MKIFIVLLTLFFSTSAFSVERLLCEVDQRSWTYVKFLMTEFLSSEKFDEEKKNKFEKLKYSFEEIFWQERRDFKKTITPQDLKLRDRAAYFELNKNIFGQYKSLSIQFNNEPIPLLKETDGYLDFRAWPHRTDYGESDIRVSINRSDGYIAVSSDSFNEFFDKEFIGFSLGWICEPANNKF